MIWLGAALIFSGCVLSCAFAERAASVGVIRIDAAMYVAWLSGSAITVLAIFMTKYGMLPI